MFEPTKKKRSDISATLLPEQMQQELWHLILLRQQKGLSLTSPQRFNFFKDPVYQTLSVVHSQEDPYFSDSTTAPYVDSYEKIIFPKTLYVYDLGEELLMTLEKFS